jgi:FkbM family methyltransferase
VSETAGATDVFATSRRDSIERVLHDTSRKLRERGSTRLLGYALSGGFLLVHMSKLPTVGQRLPVALSRQVFWQVWRRTARRTIIVRMAAGHRLALPPWSHVAGLTLSVGFHEPREELFALAYLRTGEVAIDVGANIGVWSTLMGSAGADVIAFEPGSRSRSDLVRTVGLNPGLDITVVPAALSDHPGQMNLTLDLECSNHLVEEELSERAEPVEVITLDDYIDAHPRLDIVFIKVDAEGFDLQVLQGAEKLLSTLKPSLMVETWGPPTVRNWLEKRGYRIYRYAFETRTLHEYPRHFCDQANILAVHDEKVEHVRQRLKSAPLPSLVLPRIEWRDLKRTHL